MIIERSGGEEKVDGRAEIMASAASIIRAARAKKHGGEGEMASWANRSAGGALPRVVVAQWTA